MVGNFRMWLMVVGIYWMLVGLFWLVVAIFCMFVGGGGW